MPKWEVIVNACRDCFSRHVNSRSRERTELFYNSRHVLFSADRSLLEMTFYNIHNPSSQAPMTLGSTWVVCKVKKKCKQNILNILVSTYKFSKCSRWAVLQNLILILVGLNKYCYIRLVEMWKSNTGLRALLCQAPNSLLDALENHLQSLEKGKTSNPPTSK